MAGSGVSIDYSDVERVFGNIAGAGPIVEREMTIAITRSVAVVQHDAMATVKVDTGALRRSITVNVTPYLGRVGSNLPYAEVVEKGRRRGAPPPPKGSLLGWLARHGIPAEAEFIVRQRIGQRGIPASPYLVPALERNRDGINREFEAAANRALTAVLAK